MIFMISNKSKMVKRFYSVGCENSGTRKVDYDGNFSEKMVERTIVRKVS